MGIRGRNGTFRITVSQDLARWIKGLGNFTVGEDARREWDLVNDAYFDKTQQFVHVLTGDLKSSGRARTYVDGQTIVGETAYGGTEGTAGPVDYTVYEIARGGSHDFIARALAATERQYGTGLQRAVLAEMRARLGVW